jgi:hypothetical protein
MKFYLIPCCCYRAKELSSLASDDEISRKNDKTLQLESIVRERTAHMTGLAVELDVVQVLSLVCSHLFLVYYVFCD